MKGEASVFPQPGKSFDPLLIPKAIKDAGFTPAGVQVSADGTLLKKRGQLELDIPGLNYPFLLAGGPQAGALAKKADLVGKKIRVTGKVGRDHAGSPPSLIVEDFRQSN